MRPFADVISLEAARAILDATGSAIERTETIALTDANGRVLAANAVARQDVPPFSRAGMDGYAVRARDTQARPRAASHVDEGWNRIHRRSPCDAGARRPVHRDFTGAPMPDAPTRS
jgi:molybdopterin biosynthesis enzyme